MLQSPLRLEWDLPEKEEDVLSIGKKIISSGIFQLAVRGKFFDKQKSIFSLLSEAKAKNIKVFLFLEDSYPDFLMEPEIRDVVACFVFKSPCIPLLQRGKEKEGDSKKKKAVSVFVTKNNFEDIPDLIDKAIAKSIGRFIVNNFNCWKCKKEDIAFPIEKQRLEKFKKEISLKIKFWEKNIELVIRDFFISSIFYPEREAGVITNGVYNGCQAGSSVAYVRQDGKVYGCSSIDIELGDIKTESLRDIWKNKACVLRKQVSLLPSKCVSCPLVSWCQGGCRGRSYFYDGNFEGPDPMCLISVVSR
ncbi:MAG: SPASM domain-containing protein [bacterium]